MSLPEYQIMLPSMTDGCAHLQYNSSWKFHQLAAGQLLSWQSVLYGKGMRYSPSIMYKITHDGSLSPSQPGGPSCRVSPLAFSLIEYNCLSKPHRRDLPPSQKFRGGRKGSFFC